MSPILSATSFLISVFFNTFICLLLLRFIFQLVRIDVHNPIVQFIITITNPLLLPLRRIVPSFAKVDLASILLLFIAQALELILLTLVAGGSISFNLSLLGGLSIIVLGELLNLAVNIYFYGTIILVILSWLPSHGYHPALALISQLIQPALLVFNRWIKPIAGLDLSPFFLIIFLQLSVFLIISPLVEAGRYLMIN